MQRHHTRCPSTLSAIEWSGTPAVRNIGGVRHRLVERPDDGS